MGWVIRLLTHCLSGSIWRKMLVQKGNLRKKTWEGIARDVIREPGYCRVQEEYREGRVKQCLGLQRGPTKWSQRKGFVKEKVVNDLERLNNSPLNFFNSQAVLTACYHWEVKGKCLLSCVHQNGTKKTLANYNNSSLLNIFVWIFNVYIFFSV